MKFKTIVLTRKKITTIILVSFLIVLVCILIKIIPKKSVNVFNYDQNSYEEILAEVLPDNREKSFNIKDKLKKIFGIDAQNPESILKQYSAAFEGTNIESHDAEEDKGNSDEEKNHSAEVSDRSDEPVMPDKSQINTSVGIKMNNATKYSVDIDSLCSKELPFSIDSEQPQVLVVHTHTTECYDGDQMSGESERNTDETRNIIAVGNEICSVLEENGIKTLHDTTYHDYPSYQGAYSRALTSIENCLKQYPSIKIVLDIHRDAFVYSDGSKLAVTCEENGISTAQVMIVAGTNSMGLWHENWQDNLTFAAKIQNAAEIMYPGLMRPINLRTERFNEHMTKGSLILEVGSNGNTLEQAKEGGKDVARAIAAVLKAE